MFFVVRSNDGFIFPLGLIQYIVIVTTDFRRCMKVEVAVLGFPS